MKRKIYVASSWRNALQIDVVGALITQGHEVYDFRNPQPSDSGFAWSEIDPNWQSWSPGDLVEHLRHNAIARRGFLLDKHGLDWCDTCVCVLPCGRSAHLELGYAVGAGKSTYVLLQPEKFEPELMYLLCDNIVTSIQELLNQTGPVYVER